MGLCFESIITKNTRAFAFRIVSFLFILSLLALAFIVFSCVFYCCYCCCCCFFFAHFRNIAVECVANARLWVDMCVCVCAGVWQVSSFRIKTQKYITHLPFVIKWTNWTKAVECNCGSFCSDREEKKERTLSRWTHFDKEQWFGSLNLTTLIIRLNWAQFENMRIGRDGWNFRTERERGRRRQKNHGIFWEAQPGCWKGRYRRAWNFEAGKIMKNGQKYWVTTELI